MLEYAKGYFVLALIAALFGFGDIVVAWTGVAKLLFLASISLAALYLVGHIFFGRAEDEDED